MVLIPLVAPPSTTIATEPPQRENFRRSESRPRLVLEVGSLTGVSARFEAP